MAFPVEPLINLRELYMEENTADLENKKKKAEAHKRYDKTYLAKPESKVRRLEYSRRRAKMPRTKEVTKAYRNSPKGKERRRIGKDKYNHSPKRLLTQQNLHLKKTYNITLEDYQSIHESQGGVCKICKQPQVRTMLFVDHNHETGKVRGLLCMMCNFGIGHFKEDVFLLETAIKYLKDYN